MLLASVNRSASVSRMPYPAALVTVLPVTVTGCSPSPLATTPSLPLLVMWVFETLSRTQVPGVDEQLAGPKKLAMIPLPPTFSIVLESTENGVSGLVTPSPLALAVVVRLATVGRTLDGARLPVVGPACLAIPGLLGVIQVRSLVTVPSIASASRPFPLPTLPRMFRTKSADTAFR